LNLQAYSSVNESAKIRGVALIPRISRNNNLYTKQELERFNGVTVPLNWEHDPSNVIGTVTFHYNPSQETVYYEGIITNEAAANVARNKLLFTSIEATPTEVKEITPVYKANRKKQDLPPLLHDMHDYVKKQYNSVYGYGIETDDLVSAYWFTLSKDLGRENVMIVSIDKDYRQFPALIYNYHYNHREIVDITPEEAMFNFYSQMIEGDTADNVNYFKGKGKKFAENYLKNCKTKYQYTKKMYELFKEKYKGKARQKYVECYNLLKLREQ
jgi:ethanolamine utilization protein EutP (predicted NTPase)